ncbi:unnamed protein product [Caretta caretta]
MVPLGNVCPPHCSLTAISGGEGVFPPLTVCPTRVSFPLKSRAPPPGPFSASSHPLGWASGDASSPMLACCPGNHNQPARPAPAIKTETEQEQYVWARAPFKQPLQPAACLCLKQGATGCSMGFMNHTRLATDPHCSPPPPGFPVQFNEEKIWG